MVKAIVIVFPTKTSFLTEISKTSSFTFLLRGQLESLRANFCKYRESRDSFKIFNFLIFCPNKAFSELFSKIQLKDPKALEFFQNRGKFEKRHFGLPRQLKIDKNDAFSFRSCW